MILVVKEDQMESTFGWFMPRRMPLLVPRWLELRLKDLGFIALTSPVPIVRH